MTPPLLDHPLIKKYFGTPDDTVWVNNIPYPEKEFMAYRILQAMSEPVKEGELYLAISEYGKVTGPIAFTSSDNWKFHCQWLRLPDSFQPPPERENTLNICTCKYIHFDPCHCPCHKPPSTASPCKPSHSSDSTCDQCRPETAKCDEKDKCLACGVPFDEHRKPTPAPSAVAAKIKMIERIYDRSDCVAIKDHLRELVALVRQESK